MTKGLRELLNLPNILENLNEERENMEDILGTETLDSTISTLKEIQHRLDMNEDHTDIMTSMNKEMLKHAREILDLSFNMDPSKCRGIMEISSLFFRLALDSQVSKRDNQLKMMKLELDQRKLDLEERKINHVINGSKKKDGDIVDAEYTIVADRNELLLKLREQYISEKEKK